MDWTRHYTFFKPGEEQPDLITGMVRQVRKHLDERGEREGRRPVLIMRVPATIERSLKCGLDARTWIKEGLADYLVPSSPSRFLLPDMPMAPWLELVEGTPIEIHVSPDSATWVGTGQANLTMYRAAASNYYRMGVHGFYVFNLFCQGFPLEAEQYMILKDVSDPAALSKRDKVFMAQPSGIGLQHETADMLPVSLEDPNHVRSIALWVGDDLEAARKDSILRRATLRLRVLDLGPQDRLEVALNGAMLDMSSARIHQPNLRETIAFAASLPTWTWERHETKSVPGAWCDVELREALPKCGENIVTVRAVRPENVPAPSEIRLIGLDLDVTYNYCGRDPAYTD